MTATALKSQEILKVSSNATTITGDVGSGIEVVVIDQGVTGTILDINVERVALNGSSSDFKYQNESNSLVIYSGSSTVVTIPIQADSNGTQVTFTNGTVNVFSGQSGMTFGAVPVNSGSGSSTATSITPITIDPYFVTSTGIPPVPPPPVDTTPPVYQSSTTNASGTTITLTFDEALSATTAPPTAFVVTVAGVLRAINTVTASGTDVTLTLAVPVYTGQTVVVEYTDPTAGDDANAIQDLAGNDAASNQYSVTNISTVPVPPPDITPPVYYSAYVVSTGDEISMSYSEPLTDTTTVPTSAFVVKANGLPVTVNSMHATNNTYVYLFLSPGAILKGQTITVGYVAPGGSGPDVIKDLAGNPAATSPEYLAYNFSQVTNPSDSTLPILMGAFGGNGPVVSLSYNELLGASTVSPSAFSVTVNSSPVNVISVNPISEGTNQFYLTLASDIPLGATARISYTDPGGSDAIKDVAGNHASSFVDVSMYTGVAP